MLSTTTYDLSFHNYSIYVYNLSHVVSISYLISVLSRCIFIDYVSYCTVLFTVYDILFKDKYNMATPEVSDRKYGDWN